MLTDISCGKVKYSVIIPTYNSEDTIGMCLAALYNQSINKDEYEIILVDDGSTDNTKNIVKDFPVRYCYQENSGPASARNKGAGLAKGEIILFTDADCVPDYNWISEMIKPFKDPEVVAVKGAYRTLQDSIVARFAQLEFEERFEMLKKMGSIDMIDTYSAAFKKGVFLKMGGFDTGFPVANNEDTELSYRMSKEGFKMVFNPDAVVCHLKHPDSIKRYARLKFWRGYWRMVVYKKFPEKMVKDTYTPQTLKLQIIILYCIIPVLFLYAMFPNIGLYPFLIMAILFGIVLVPFIIFSLIKDPFLTVYTPFMLLVRAASLGFGVFWGILYLMMKR